MEVAGGVLGARGYYPQPLVQEVHVGLPGSGIEVRIQWRRPPLALPSSPRPDPSPFFLPHPETPSSHLQHAPHQPLPDPVLLEQTLPVLDCSGLGRGVAEPGWVFTLA